MRTKAKLLGVRYPGIRMLIVRRTYPELVNNHIRLLRTELLEVARYNLLQNKPTLKYQQKAILLRAETSASS